MKRTIKWIIFLSLLGGLAWYLEFSGYLYHNHILSMKYDIHGIDISHHKVRLNWYQIDKRYKFVFMKATEGKDHLDRDFFYNWNKAQLTGFRVGAYHFFSMLSKGKEQAKFYISKVPIVEKAFPPIIDLEIPTKYPKEVVNKELKDLIDILEKHYRKRAIIYVTRHTYKAYIENEFLDNPIWVRNIKWYPSQKRWDFWQYSNRGRVKGISGFTDRNAFKGTDIDEFITKNKIVQ
ncbi:glycoside hydrolase [Streptobacillus moniliformis]|uniref:Glycoside hydrolase family 25 n=1 Tax=Streptobacillus moniliformis (strain ATCC 14647 / DSM 12112 / NCTC 10651 / 9901) TaxID=519441 RepID=D1AW45_STRM9|nr:GH25 family lysozyme [Streptobacillus moniliformis]ACZ00521.1 glycoside hydrolase family 25 [Streptobacillus moniliformis DSM 12112]AVL43061.1 glycoside hydrolase [Streptobacillus moniliformis]QXW65292.1 glycoside hydrolase [Streptobacillus moniliformis]SQA12833.1 Lysozyme M1 precursor [Streptobacillus moniliformis]